MTTFAESFILSSEAFLEHLYKVTNTHTHAFDDNVSVYFGVAGVC